MDGFQIMSVFYYGKEQDQTGKGTAGKDNRSTYRLLLKMIIKTI